MSAVDGLRREERDEGVVRPPSEGVGVQDGRSLCGLELAETTEVLILLPARSSDRAADDLLLRRSLLP